MPHLERRAGPRARPRAAAGALRLAAGLALALLLSACRMDLFTKQSEADANDMVAALRSQGVSAEKHTPDSGKSWSVRVDEEEIVRAMAVLRASGLPQNRYSNLGELFKKEGLVSTPTEERVRFMHGVTEELSGTLARIDGVIDARVHIVLPQNDPLAPAPRPSSASVFVKYRPEANLASLVPAIKNLVSRSVEGLVYDNVSVTLVAGEMVMPARPQPASTPWGWIVAGGVLLLALVAGAVLAWRQPAWLLRWLPAGVADLLRRRRPAAAAAADAAPQPDAAAP